MNIMDDKTSYPFATGLIDNGYKLKINNIKLYTEEQIMEAYNIGVEHGDCGEYIQDINKFNLTPIELPSDKEIKKFKKRLIGKFYKDGFDHGCKWIIDKILNK